MLNRDDVKRNLYDLELLTILMEECAEVIQAAAKVQRYGWESAYEGESAQERLEKELGDLQCIVDLLHEGDCVSYTKMDEYAGVKHEKLRKWSNLLE